MGNFTTPHISVLMLDLLEQIGELLGRLAERYPDRCDLCLRRVSRIKTIQGSLQIEGNPLSLEQVTAVLDGKKVIAAPRHVLEICNAMDAYDAFDIWMPDSQTDLLAAHAVMMKGLVDDPGQYRSASVGVKKGESVVHIAPPAHMLNSLMSELFNFIAKLEIHPLITSCIFHYEFEYIHPFSDGNGRLGRLWQTLILSQWKEIFQDIPVESVIKEHQQEYYDVLNQSNRENHSGAFVEFMLKIIHETLSDIATEEAPVKASVKPSVKQLLKLLNKVGSLGNQAILKHLKLKDRRRMRESYIKPAIEQGLIEYTIPDKPNSRNQEYRLTKQGKNWSKLKDKEDN
jgi:cell filamentation protein, protein adenylyltransferase